MNQFLESHTTIRLKARYIPTEMFIFALYKHAMDDSRKKWIYLIVLSLVWGSSYILIKKALIGLSPMQLGSVRIVFSSVFLFAIGFGTLKNITKAQWPWVALSALCGTFAPVFLFSYAETEIDSSIAAILNSLVPLFTIFLGYILFKVRFTGSQVLGVLLGLLGAGVLIFKGAQVNPEQNYLFSLFVVIAALCYAANANIVKTKLQDVSPKGIAVGNFAVMVLPALGILCFSGIFNQETCAAPAFAESMGYIVILSILGTGIAKILFNRLIQISTAVFSTSVTYLIPIVGIFWGLLDGEAFTLIHLLASGIILIGVWLVNRKRKQNG